MTIQLTKYLNVANGSHILYFFDNKDKYIENMMAYIRSGIKRQHHILIIESAIMYSKVEERIKLLFTMDEQKMIHYIDSNTLYQHESGFHIQHTTEQFEKLFLKFKEKNISFIRTWSHHQWYENTDTCQAVEKYESFADSCIRETGRMTVCAYSSSDFSASFQTTLMRSHEYLMTDDEFVKSTLYRK